MLVQVFLVKSQAAALRVADWIATSWLPYLKLDQPLVVEVYSHEALRTPRQNKRYWSVVLQQIAQKAWIHGRRHSMAWWHKELALLFNPVDGPNGEIVAGSTAQLTIMEFHRYMLQVEEFAREQLNVEFDDDLEPLVFSEQAS